MFRSRMVKQLKEALVLIDEMDTPLDRAFAYQNQEQRRLDLNPSHHLSLPAGQRAGRSELWEVISTRVIANAKPIDGCAYKGWKAFNTLTIVIQALAAWVSR